MSKIYFFAAGILVAGALSAQPTLTQANHAPTIGETFTNVQGTWDGTIPASGANQTWDFSGLTMSSTQVLEYKAPVNCTAYMDFPGATIGGDADAGATFSYSDYTSTQQENYGYHITSQGVSQFYNNPEVMMVYPFTMGTTNSDYFESTFFSGVTWYRSGTTTIEAIGYGEVILPTGTISNVLLYKLEQDYQDSSTSLTNQYQSEIYLWAKPGYHNTVLGLTKFTFGGNSSYTSTYDSNPSLGNSEIESTSLTIFPNPVEDVINLNYSNSADITEVLITNVAGQNVYSSQYFENKINLEHLIEGIYFIELSVGEDKVVKKFVKK